MHSSSFARIRTLLALAVALLGTATVRAQIVLPPEGDSLKHIHVLFQWPPVLAANSYRLWVVQDDGLSDPFSSGSTVVDTIVDAAEPTLIVKSGLEFGRAYAWRVRGIETDPLPWGPTHRFTTAPLPDSVPAITISSDPQAVGNPEPGLTLFPIRNTSGVVPGQPIPRGLAVAVDSTGRVVWFAEPATHVGDLRLLESGRVLYISGNRAYETTLHGGVTWASPDDPDLAIHHEVFPLPNGNFLALIFEFQEVLRNLELQTWRGDAIVELDRDTGQIVWSWSSFDNFSTLDFDPDRMQNPGLTGYDWTHSNAVVFDQSDNSIYLSLRHLSRITKIDYATGDIIYNMGFDMPSGDADFGDNLFSFQHAPQLLPNGNIMVYDNGNRRDHVDQSAQTGITRAIELTFSSGNRPEPASITWEYTQTVYSSFVGDTDRLPGGNTLVTAGPQKTIVEVNPAGAVLWQLQLPANGNHLIYRAERIPELVIAPPPGDADDDGVPDDADNCPSHFNPQQNDCDGDDIGDLCAIRTGSSQDCDASGIPDHCETDVSCICPFACFDLNGDNSSNLFDFVAFAECFGSNPRNSQRCACADFDGDFQVNLADFSLFSANFLQPTDIARPNCAPTGLP